MPDCASSLGRARPRGAQASSEPTGQALPACCPVPVAVGHAVMLRQAAPPPSAPIGSRSPRRPCRGRAPSRHRPAGQALLACCPVPVAVGHAVMLRQAAPPPSAPIGSRSLRRLCRGRAPSRHRSRGRSRAGRQVRRGSSRAEQTDRGAGTRLSCNKTEPPPFPFIDAVNQRGPSPWPHQAGC